MKILGIIGARGGSKGILRKNISILGGKPLIGWTIEAALQSSSLERPIVSTDDPEIAATARDLGADVPFMRPPELATDTASQVDVVNHLLDWLDRIRNYRPEYLMLLQPTSPFRTAEDIDAAVLTARGGDFDAVVSVSEVASHPYYARTIDDRGIIQDLFVSRNTAPRRQLLPPVFTENGAIYLVKTAVFRQEQSFMPTRSAAYVMPPERALDIDTPLDLRQAECLLRINRR